MKGPLKKWKGTADSGNAVWRWFCGDCGSPIAHDPEAAPPIIALKGGSLDVEIKKTLKPVCIPIPCHTCELCECGADKTATKKGHRDLDCRQTSLLPGASGQAV